MGIKSNRTTRISLFCAPGGSFMWRTLLLFHWAEVFLAYAAEGAYPVGGQVFEGGAGGYAIVGVALGGIILVVADVANVLFHGVEF